MSDAGSDQELDLSNVRVDRMRTQRRPENRPARAPCQPALTHPPVPLPQSDVVTKYKAAAEIANGEW